MEKLPESGLSSFVRANFRIAGLDGGACSHVRTSLRVKFPIETGKFGFLTAFPGEIVSRVRKSVTFLGGYRSSTIFQLIGKGPLRIGKS